MEAVAEHELSVVLSSHLVSDLERVCDYLIVLVDSRVQLAGEVDDAARDAPPADRAAARPGACPRASRSIEREPHRPAEHAARPHRRADPRPRLDRRASSAWRTSCSPTWASPAPPSRRRRWRRSDDLAHLAPVPRPGRGRLRRRWRCSPLLLVVTGRAARRRWHGDSALRPPQQRAADVAVLHGFVRSRWSRRRSSACSGARRWSPASWRPARTGSCGTRASPARAGWRQARARRRWPRWPSRALGLAVTWWSGPIDTPRSRGQEAQGISGARASARRCSSRAASRRSATPVRLRARRAAGILIRRTVAAMAVTRGRLHARAARRAPVRAGPSEPGRHDDHGHTGQPRRVCCPARVGRWSRCASGPPRRGPG